MKAESLPQSQILELPETGCGAFLLGYLTKTLQDVIKCFLFLIGRHLESAVVAAFFTFLEATEPKNGFPVLYTLISNLVADRHTLWVGRAGDANNTR